jgi:beta-glucanase (GH16 family)
MMNNFFRSAGMRAVSAAVLAMVIVFFPSCTEEDVLTAPASPKLVEDLNWKFEETPFWADEFDQDGKPSSARWQYEVGFTGWGNNELQYYTRGDNASIKDGILTIEARKEDKGEAKYTSSRIISRGLGDFLYGRFEARMKLPAGRGTWPAFWMLPSDFSYGVWPKSGEIDVMEHVGWDPGVVHVTVHTEKNNFANGTQVSGTKNVPDFSSEFHLYRVDWTPYAVRGYVDGEKVFEYVNKNTGYSAWPFNKRFFLLLNLAIGGQWGGAKGVDDTIFPARFLIDYVRVYKMVN